jgi:hypothetical protein
VRPILSKHIELKTLDKMMRNVPKTFLDRALVAKHRHKLYRSLKQKHSAETARLFLGLYQPSPVDTSELIRSKNYPVVSELARIFADDFETEIPTLIHNMDKTALIIFAKMKDVDLDNDTRGEVLKALLPIAAKGKRREVGLKAFARIYRPSFHSLVQNIKFAKNELNLKIQFYARIKTVPRRLTSDFEELITTLDQKTAKNALKIAATENNERTIPIHLAALDVFPAITFESYLSIAAACFEWNTPSVFRTFAQVMQHSEAEVRRSAINSLANALKKSTTPIQFLSLFALSATDPVQDNLNEAEKQLEFAIRYRREVLKQLAQNAPAIAPESALQFLINILAHHKNFDEDSTELPTFATYLKFFLTPLCADTTDFGGILRIFLELRFLDDVEEAYTEKMVKLCDLASAIVKEIGGGRDWDDDITDFKFEYSSRYFKPCQNRDRLRQLLKRGQRDEPKSPKLGKEKQLLRAGMSPILKSPKMRRQTESSGDEEDWRRRKGKSAPATPLRNAPRIGAGPPASATPKRKRPPRSPSPSLLD